VIFDVDGTLVDTRERSLVGLAAARARGRNGGRLTVMTPAKIARARELYAQGDLTVVETPRASASAWHRCTGTCLTRAGPVPLSTERDPERTALAPSYPGTAPHQGEGQAAAREVVATGRPGEAFRGGTC
jgi:phosphoglycolate phosphatase-like HAD superfamily hydrolase